MRAVVEELLPRDQIVFDGINTDFFEGDALTGRFGRDVQAKEHDELVRICAIEKWPCHSLSVEGFVGDPVLGFLDHWTLAGGLLAVAFNRNNVWRVQRTHDVEVLALPAQLNKLAGNRSNASWAPIVVLWRAQWGRRQRKMPASHL
jgi:hypothetical protein